MRIAVSRLVVALAVLTFGLSAAAEAGPLHGHVRNQAGAAVPFATVDVFDLSGEPVATASTDGTGFYSIAIADGTYDVRVTPPAGSGYTPAMAFAVGVQGDTTLDFALVTPGGTTFRGRLIDATGAGIPNQQVQLFRQNSEVGMSATTDVGGTFSFNVDTGSYFLLVHGDNQSFTSDAPQFFSIQTDPFEITGNTDVNLPLPVKRVTVQVRDGAQTPNPVAGASLFTSSALNCELMFGPYTACGASSYDDSFSPNATTDGSGNVVLFLFPTQPLPPPPLPDEEPLPPTPSYSLTATPPPPSGLGAGSVSGVRFSADHTLTITLNPPTVLSGELRDGLGVGIPNQTMQLVADGQETGVGTTTDGLGRYSFAVPPGTYRLNVFGDNQGFASSSPQAYSLNSGPFTISGSEVRNFQLPVVRVDVQVRSSAGAPVAGVGLSTTAVSNCSLSFGSTTACGASNYIFDGSTGLTNPSGNITLWLFPTPPDSPDPNVLDSYRFTATPQMGSGYATTTESNIQFASNAVITITLATPVTVTGKLTDRLGAGIANQFFEFVSEDTGAATGVITDADVNPLLRGNYTAQLQEGNYSIRIFGDNQNFTAAGPQFYNLNTATIAVSSQPNQVINLTLPAKKLDVTVQDSNNTPIANVGLSAVGPFNCQLTFGAYAACGSSQYFYSRPGPGEPPPPFGVTGGDGKLTLWLFPTTASNPENYTLTATPLADSGFDEKTVAGVTLTNDANLVIVLLLNSHAAPVTTLDISPEANQDSTYSDPSTITLSATAAATFSIDATFYEIDGTGVQQYSDPFQVAGGGAHVVRYFSVDNEGVQETPKSFAFTIAETTPPVTTATVSPDANAAGWHSSDVTVQLTAVDEAGGSGVLNITYMISGAQATPASVVSGDTATISITTDGVSEITFWAIDSAGNGEAPQTLTVQLNRTAPTITGSASPAPNANGWNTTPVTVTFTCSDSNSGLAPGSPPDPTVLSTDGADQSVTGTCTNNAGNSASATVSDIDIDLTGPEAYTQFNPATKDLSVFGRDSVSGVPAGAIAPSSVVPAGAGVQIRTYDITDNAGNVTQLVVRVQKGAKTLSAQIVSIKYGSAAATTPAPNQQTFNWTVRGDGTMNRLEQVMSALGHLVDADFVMPSNRTKITRWLPLPVVRETRTGLVLLRTATSNGNLSVEY